GSGGYLNGLAPSTFRRSPGAPVHSITTRPCPQQPIMPAAAAAMETSAAEAAVEPAPEAEAEEEVGVGGGAGGGGGGGAGGVVGARVAPSAASCWRQSAWNC